MTQAGPPAAGVQSGDCGVTRNSGQKDAQGEKSQRT